MREQHLDVLSLTLRRDIGIGFGRITGQIVHAFSD
jgi:peptidyl-tRNA hydrolase